MTANTQPIDLLLVDDEPLILRSLRALFRGEHYRVQAAGSGAEALDCLARQPVDVLVTDMRMPGMDGRALLGEVKQQYPEVMRIVLSGYAEPDRVMETVNEVGIFAYVGKPWDNADLRLKVERAAEQRRLRQLVQTRNAELKALNAKLEAKVEARTAQLKRAWDYLVLNMLDLEESYRAVVNVLSHVTEQRLPEVRRHADRVARTAVALARALRLPRAEVTDVETAALLQNIGLLGFPDEVLNQSPPALDAAQQAAYRRHPLIAETALQGITAMREVARIIRAHHEAFDGSGYPDGLRGEAIPLGARIIALAGDYEDLRGDADDGTPAAVATVLATLKPWVGRRYDPQVFDALTMVAERANGQQELWTAPVLTLRSSDLRPGMVLFDKIVSRDGALLLGAGQALSAVSIGAIQRLEQAEDVRRLFRVYQPAADDAGD